MTTHIITPADDPVVFDGSSTWKGNSIVAGDTVEVQSGTYSDKLVFRSVAGTSGSKITITNSGGLVDVFTAGNEWAILVDECEYVDILGNGHSGLTYGIKANHRFKIHDKCNNILIQYCEVTSPIAGRDQGFHVDQNDFPLVEITDITIDHCYIHGVTSASYCGNNRNSLSDPDTDNILRRITQTNNIIDDCYEGIQSSSTPEGMVITDNTLTNVNPANINVHNAAISIGKGSVGEIARNTIKDCDGFGIAYTSNGTIESVSDVTNIHHNVVHNCGSHATSGRNDGIKIQAAIEQVNVYNNTVTQTGNGSAGRGIRIADTGAFAYDNISVDNDSEGISLAGAVPSTNAHDNLSQTASESVDSAAHTPTSIKFVDYANDNFHLESDSPAIGAASDGGDIGALGLEGAVSENETVAITDAASVVAVPPGDQTDITISVGSGSDDGRQLDTGSVNLAQTGSTINDVDDYFAFRFTSVSIPPFSTINSCIATFDVVNTLNDSPNSELFFEDVDNSAALTETNSDFSNRTGTTAKITWQEANIGAGFRDSPDLKSSLQEVVSRAGWLSGGAITLLVRHLSDTDGFRVNMFENGAANVVSIDINYTAPLDVSDVSVSDTVTVSELVSVSVAGPSVDTSDNATVTDSGVLTMESGVEESDSVTISEAVELYMLRDASSAETIAISEAINVLVDQIGVIMVNVSDLATMSEASSSAGGDLELAVADNISLVDAPNASLMIYVSASDTVTITESTAASNEALSLYTSDTVTITESNSCFVTTDVNASETVTLADASLAGFNEAGGISQSDSVTITDAVDVQVLTEVHVVHISINVYDNVSAIHNLDLVVPETVSIAEAVNIQPETSGELLVNVGEAVLFSESSASENPESLEVATSDTVAITESSASAMVHCAIISESVTITENTEIDVPVAVNVSDTVSVGESIMAMSIFVVAVVEFIDIDTDIMFDRPTAIDVSDTVAVSESTGIDSMAGEYGLSVSDAFGLTESLESDLPIDVSAQDGLSIVESLEIKQASAPNASDIITVSESVGLFFPGYVISVNELVGVSESFVLYEGGLISVSVSDSD